MGATDTNAQKEQKTFYLVACAHKNKMAIITDGAAKECCPICGNPGKAPTGSPQCEFEIKIITMISFPCPLRKEQFFYKKGAAGDFMPDPFVHCRRICGMDIGKVCEQESLRVTAN